MNAGAASLKGIAVVGLFGELLSMLIVGLVFTGVLGPDMFCYARNRRK
jgi:hypothetical protein